MKVSARAYYIIGVILSVMLFAGCEEPVMRSYVDVPIQLSLPREGYIASNAPQQRAMGDPGTEELFNMPTHVYIFCVFDLINDNTQVVSILDTLLSAEDWKPSALSGEDIIYNCIREYHLEIPHKDLREAARVFVAVSDTSLSLRKKNGNTVTAISKADEDTWPESEAEVLSITFNVDDKMQSHLHNIYSSPYNYKQNGVYYGEIANVTTNVPSVYLMLYHVASKVDLMWNVQSNKREDIRVSKVKVKNLFEGDAYLFKPTRTLHDKFTGTGAEPNGYTPADIAGDSPGTWWAGRSYIYTMAYQATISEKVVFPLQVEIEVKDMKTVGTPKDTFDITFMKEELDTVFAPWLRGQITISRLPKDNKTKEEVVVNQEVL